MLWHEASLALNFTAAVAKMWMRVRRENDEESNAVVFVSAHKHEAL